MFELRIYKVVSIIISYLFARWLNGYNVCVFKSCAGRFNCGLSKCWYWSRILFCRARPLQQLQGNVLNFPFSIIKQKILFWSAIRSQIIFQFHFAFSLLPPSNDHGLAVNSFDGLQYEAMQESVCCARLSICCRWSFLITRVLMNRTLPNAIFFSPPK